MRRALVFVLALAVAHANPPHHHAGSGVVALDVFGSGGPVHLLVAEQQEGKPRLFHLRSADGGETWSEPSRVDANGPPPFSPHRGNDPQIAAAGDRLVAVWTTAGTDAWGSGPMATALSTDGGKTWTPGPNPADDGATTGHGFMDIACDAKGRFHLVWLDSRDGSQGLRYANSPDGTKWSANVTVKAGTCECCPNSLATAAGRVAILYRAHDPRDMRVVVSSDIGATWPRNSTAGEFGWKFDGCPHAGGGLAFVGDTMHALVWTGHAERAGVHHLVSRNGETWSAPLRVGPADATHPDLASNGGRLAAVWESDAAIWAAHSADGAQWSNPARISGSAASHPRIIRTPGGFRGFWTETPEGKPAGWRSMVIPAQ